MNAHSLPKQSAPSQAVPLLDVNRQFRELKAELLSVIEKVCDSGRFIFGPECEELERSAAAYCQTPHGVACASGSDALLLALMALDVGPGDEVLLPSYTFFATASAAWRLGAKPVFVDIEPESYNICPADAARRVTARTKAIIPVHLFGQSANMPAILELAEKHHLAVIEDAAQAIGAEWEGKRAGSWGDVGCLSFYPTKNLGGFGDGGMLVTRDARLAERLRLLRAHGMHPRYYHQAVGINSRLDTLQAAVLLVKMRHLDRWTAMRIANAKRYGGLFAAAGLDKVLALPSQTPGCRHVWNQYVIRVPEGQRDGLREYLTKVGVGTEIYYPVPLHRQECFRSLRDDCGELVESDRAARQTLALPIFPELTAAEQETVVEAIGLFFGLRPTSAPPLGDPKFLKSPRRQNKGVAG